MRLPPEQLAARQFGCLIRYRYRGWKILHVHAERYKRYKVRAYPPGADLLGDDFLRARTQAEAVALIDRKMNSEKPR